MQHKSSGSSIKIGFTENDHRENGKITTPHLFQWNMMNRLVKAERGPLELEQRQLAEGTHPSYLADIASHRERFEREVRRIDGIEKRENAIIEAAYQQEMAALEREYENCVSDLVETFWQELEDKKRQLDGEATALEVGLLDDIFASGGGGNKCNSNVQQWSKTIHEGPGMPGKKQLRRRPNEMPNSSTASNPTSSAPSNSAEQSSGGGPAEKKSRKRSPGAGQNCPLITQTLLSAQAIGQDVDRFYPAGTDLFRHSSSSRSSSHIAVVTGATTSSQSISSEHYYHHRDHAEDKERDSQQVRKPRKVALEQGKMSCDGKTFHRGQNVSIQSANTGWKQLQARIIQINDLTIQFRSAISGDTRTVTASKEDLETGRVLVWKRY